MRLARYLSLCGVASRRKCEKIIASGRVAIDGSVIIDPAFKVDEQMSVSLDGKILQPLRTDEYFYAMFHKPVGVVSTLSVGSERGPCLSDIINLPVRVFPVGRLDRDSSGLLLLTNDGDLTYKIIHPKHKILKEYYVRLNRQLQDRDVERIVKGIIIDERKVEVHSLAPIGSKGYSWRIVIHEGRKHIVRRLFKALNITVLELKRTRIGPISLGRLPIGRWRKLTPNEIIQLKKACSLDEEK